MPAMTFTKTTGDGSGTDEKFGFNYDDLANGGGTGSIGVSWSSDDTKVAFTHAFDDTKNKSGNNGKGDDTFLYDDTKKIMTARSNYELGNDKYEDSVKIQIDAESKKNGVIYSGTLSANGNGSNYAADLKGYADDDGGYVETKYTYSVYDISVFGTLADGDYIVAPSTVAQANVTWETSTGVVSKYDGTTSAQYWGSGLTANTAVAGVKIYAYTYDAATYALTVGAEVTGVTLNAGAKTNYSYWYIEAFDGEGTLTAASVKERRAPRIPCSLEAGTA